MDHYVVYKKPKDYPDEFVVRKWEIDVKEGKAQPRPKEVIARDKDYRKVISKMMSAVPRGLDRIDRSENDDPTILETWI